MALGHCITFVVGLRRTIVTNMFLRLQGPTKGMEDRSNKGDAGMMRLSATGMVSYSARPCCLDV